MLPARQTRRPRPAGRQGVSCGRGKAVQGAGLCGREGGGDACDGDKGGGGVGNRAGEGGVEEAVHRLQHELHARSCVRAGMRAHTRTRADFADVCARQPRLCQQMGKRSLNQTLEVQAGTSTARRAYWQTGECVLCAGSSVAVRGPRKAGDAATDDGGSRPVHGSRNDEHIIRAALKIDGDACHARKEAVRIN